MRAVRTNILRCVIAGVVVACGGHLSQSAEIPDIDADRGPFLVVAKAFRGEDAEDKAKALASELKDKNGFPTYLFRTPRDRARSHKPVEVIVFVGDAQTFAEARTILKAVKKSTVGSALRPVVTFNPLRAPAR